MKKWWSQVSKFQGSACFLTSTFEVMWTRRCGRAGWGARWVRGDLRHRTLQNTTTMHSCVIFQCITNEEFVNSVAQANQSGGIQAGRCASAQRVALAHCEQRGRHDRTEVVEGPASNALVLLCDAAGLRHVLWEQLGQQGFFCVAVAAKRSSHAEQTGDDIPAQEDCGQEDSCEAVFTEAMA